MPQFRGLTLYRWLGTFRSDYSYDYEISNVHLARTRDSVKMSRKLVLSSKYRRPLADYEIFKKTCSPEYDSVQES